MVARWLAAALLGVCLAGGHIASAQPAPSNEAVEAARLAFGDAERAFAAKDFGKALELFRLAFEKAPRDAVRFNIAVCLAELGRYEEAQAEYRLAAVSSTLTEDEKALARQRADELDAKTKPPEPAPPPATGEKIELRHGLAGWLTVGGAIVAGIGTAGIIGFGLRTADLGDQYLAAPSSDLRDEGLLMRGFTNGSIGVLGLGALLIVADLALFRTGERVEWVVAPAHLGLRARF